jgi:galactonate dehydratase
LRARASCSSRVRKILTFQSVRSIRTSTENDIEPLLPTQPSEFADLGRLVSTPIAAGERLYSRHEFRPYFEGHALDVAQPDVSTHLSVELQSPFLCLVFANLMFQRADKTDEVSHCGGISELARIASMAETYDVALAPHCPLGPIALAACIAVGVSKLNCGSLTCAPPL